MAKIQTYSLSTLPLSLSDMLIGTEVGGPIPNATKNFSLGDLLDLFRSSASPLTTKGDLYTFSTINARLSVGTNGQILSADSTEATGLKWVNAPVSSPLTTKGDIYIYSTTNARLGVGTNGQILSADSTQASGLIWIDAPSTSPLTTKGDLYTFDTVNARLSVGSNGQILSVDSTEPTGLKWINAPSGTSPLTTKGDIYVFGTTNTRLPIGADSQVLIADSTQPTGLRWAGSPIGTGYYAQYFSYSTQTATTNNVGKAMIFETFDMSNGVTVVTDGTNLTKITFANAGKYNLQFSTQLQSLSTAPEDVYIWLRKNGTTGTADVVGSTGVVGMEARKGPSDPYHIIAGWNFLLDVNANDFYQIVWATTNVTAVEIRFYAATANHPSTASTLFTVTQPGGGGGGTQNLDNVLFQGGSFTSSRYSDLDFYDWELARVGKFRISSAMPSVWEFSENKLQFYDEEYANNLFYADYFTNDLKLGDFRNYTNGCYINIANQLYKFIDINAEDVSMLRIDKREVTIGDVGVQENGNRLTVDDFNKRIYTWLSQDGEPTNFGFDLRRENLIASFGDWGNENNKVQVNILDSAKELYIHNPDGIIYIGDGKIDNTGNVLMISNGIYNRIESFFNNQQYGIELDYNSITAKIGDYGGNNQFTQIEIYDTTREIYLQSSESIYIGDRKLYSGGMYLNIDTAGNVINAIDYNANVPFGIQLLMNTYDFYFGDFSGQIHGANLRVSGGGDITTYGLIGGGMNAYGFTTSINGNYTKLGDFLQYKTWTTFEISDNAEPIIYTKFYGQNWGIKILNQDLTNATDNIAVFGDHRGAPTNIALRLNYLGNSFNLDNVDEISLDGNVRSATAGGNSGQHLKIKINGIDYKINLLDP